MHTVDVPVTRTMLVTCDTDDLEQLKSARISLTCSVVPRAIGKWRNNSARGRYMKCWQEDLSLVVDDMKRECRIDK